MGVPTLKVEIAFPTDPLDIPDSTSGLDPKTISGLVVWYDFTDATYLFEDTARTDVVDVDGDSIAGVTDKSGRGFHLQQGTAGARPLYKTAIINGKSVVRFDGTDDYLLGFNTPLGSVVNGVDYTVFVVGRCVGIATADVLFALHSSTDADPIKAQIGFIGTGAFAVEYRKDDGTGLVQTGTVDSDDGVFRVYEAQETAGIQRVFRNGTLDATSSALGAGAVTVSRFALGVQNIGGPGFLNGDIAEVLLYNRALTDMERRVIEQYLAVKYNLTIAGSDWTDVSASVRSTSIGRGRDHELSRSQAGQSTTELSNLDRRFDPTNVASPYYPYVIPMRQIRISAVWSAVTYPLFTGYIEDWGPTWLPRPIKGGGDAVARVRAVDGFKVLSLFEMAGSGLYSETVLADDPVDYWQLEEAAGSGTVADVGSYNNALTVNGAQATLGVSPSPLAGPNGAADIISVGNTPLRDASAAGWTDENTMAIQAISCDFWIKVDAYPVGNACGIISVTGSSGGAGIMEVALNATGRIILGWREHASGFPGQERFMASDGSVPLGEWTHVGVTRMGEAAEFWFNGELDTATSFPGAGTYGSIASGQTPTLVVGAFEDEAGTDFLDAKLAHVAIYAPSIGGTSFTAHASATLQGSGTTDTAGAQIAFLLDAIGWPAARRALDVGDSNMGDLSVSGSILESILAIGEDAEQGLVQMTNDGNVLFHERSTVLEHTSTVVTFSDAGTDTRYRVLDLRADDQDIYTQVIATGSFVGASEQIATGATVTKFGPRVLSKTSLHLATNAEVANLAGYLAARYDEPEVRVARIGLPMVADADWPAILGLDTHHARVALVRTPPGGGVPITKNAHVEGLAWNIVPADGVWEPSFSLVPAFEEEFWILGTSAFDDETIFAW
jgi:hypothetical protein